MSAVITPFSLEKAIELNFVIHKFSQLSPSVKRLIYELLKSETAPSFKGLANLVLLELITTNQEELTAFVNTGLEVNLTQYFVWSKPDDFIWRASFFGDYFREHLRLAGEKPEFVFIDPVKIERRARL